jgi:hypothetical protein
MSPCQRCFDHWLLPTLWRCPGLPCDTFNRFQPFDCLFFGDLVTHYHFQTFVVDYAPQLVRPESSAPRQFGQSLIVIPLGLFFVILDQIPRNAEWIRLSVTSRSVTLGTA